MTRKEKIIIWASIIITTIIINLLLPIDYDTAWEFNCTLNIVNGKIIYKDFNSVITPLYYYLSAIPVFFIRNVIGYKIVGIILDICLFYITKEIIKIFNQKNTYIIFLITFLPLLLVTRAQYNLLVTIFALSCGIFIIKYFKTEKKYFLILISLFLSFIVLTKQSTGCVITILIFAYLIIQLIKKRKVLNIILLIIPFIAIIFITILILKILNIEKEALEYTVFGVSSFSQNNHLYMFEKFREKEQTLCNALCFSLIILIISNVILNIKRRDKDIFILQIIALGNATVIYPIANSFHLLFAIIPFFIFFLILIFNNFKDDMKNGKIIVALYIMIFFSLIGIHYIHIIKDEAKICNTGYIVNSYINNKEYTEISDILTYKKEHPQYTLYSPEKSYTLTELCSKKYVGKYLNTFLYGNLGTKDPVNVIKDYEGHENTYMYIYKNNNIRNSIQTPLSAIEYIEENYELVDTTEFYKIYKVK